MLTVLGRLAKDEEAQDLAEYGIALAVIAGFAVAIAFVIAGDVETLWSNANTNINDVVNSLPPN